MAQEQAVQNIGEMLLSEGLITEKQLTAAKQTQRETDQPLGRILVEMGLITENVKMDLLNKKTGYQVLDLSDQQIDSHIFKMIDRSVLYKHHIVPVKMDRDGLLLAMEDPTDIVLIDSIEDMVMMKINPAISSNSDIEEVLEKFRSSEPEEDLSHEPLHIRRPFWYRIISGLFLPIFVLGPIPAAILLVFFNEDVSEILEGAQSATDPFQVFLFSLLGYGLWAVIMYEIDGFIFKRSHEKEKKKQLAEESEALES